MSMFRKDTNKYRKTNLWTTFLLLFPICPKMRYLSTQVEEELAKFLGTSPKSS